MSEQNTSAAADAVDAVVLAYRQLGERIAQRFAEQNVVVSPLFASLVVSALRLQNDEANLSAAPSAEEEAELTERARSWLVQDPSDAELETLRLQAVFESVYANEVVRLQTIYDKKEKTNAELLTKIVELGTNLSSNEQVANLYRTIFKLLLANSGSEPSQAPDRIVEREIAAALESVFPQSGLSAFNLVGETEKRSQINDLVRIVLGIRLFNRSINKGGVALRDVSEIAQTEVEQLQQRLHAEETEFGTRALQYSKVLTYEYDHPGSITGLLKKLISEQVFHRQYLLLLQQLQVEANESQQLVAALQNDAAASLQELNELVGSRASVPKEEVYPRFRQVAEAWNRLDTECEKNRSRLTILEEVVKLRNAVPNSITSDDLRIASEGKTAHPSIGEKLSFDFVTTITRSEISSADPAVVYRIAHDSSPEFMSLPLEYQGFCPWALAKRNGLLVPGSPYLGILLYQGNLYSLSTHAAMREFCESAARVLAAARKEIFRRPGLLHLLNVQNTVPECSLQNLMAKSAAAAQDLAHLLISAKPKTTEIDVQTPEHFEEGGVGIDYSYHWNEWELRRRAVQLTNLMNKRTSSTQTNNSHFRREAETQCYVPRPNPDGSMPGQGTQTGITKGTNVAKQSRYVAGLRGDPKANVRVVTLELESTVTEGSNGRFVQT